MAKSIEEWYDIAETQYVTEMQQVGITVDTTTWSKTNMQRIFLWVMATLAYAIDVIKDIFKTEVADTIDNMKPHSPLWYANLAKAFQYGDDLISDSDKYDNTGRTDAQIAAKKIVSYAAVVEQERGLRIKVAKTAGDDLDALAAGELAAFVDYMQKVKDAGVKLLITTGPADQLRLVLRIVYNPLVLTSTGARIDGATMTPVRDAIKEHLRNLPFNGVFSVQQLVDIIQSVEGVSDLNVDEVQTKYGLLPFTTVDISIVPDAGYLRISDENLIITYIPA